MTDDKKGQNLIFIGGCPRSGTTLLQRIVGSHPDIYSRGEFQLMNEFISLRKKMHTKVDVGSTGVIATKSSLDQALRFMIYHIFCEKLRNENRRIFAEKTPHNALIIDDILKLFPLSRFIAILRDPRDIANSMRGVRNRYKSNSLRPPEIVRSTARSIDAINLYFRAIMEASRNDDRVLVVYYEDLKRDPDGEAKRICTHIGVEYRSEMVGLGASAKADGLWYTNKATATDIRTSGAETNTQVITDREKGLVELFTKDMPELSRYNLQQRTPTLVERARFFLGKIH